MKKMNMVGIILLSLCFIGTNVNASTENHKITYNLNGGINNELNPFTYESNEVVTLKAPTKSSYLFAGWYTDNSFTKKISSIRERNMDINLYAKWVPETYKITYNLSGGVNNKANPSTYTIESIITLKAPTKSGYRFAGWYNDDTLTKKVTTIKASTGNKVLYANWVPNFYTIRFNGNGAAGGSMNDATKRNYGTNYTLPANKYYRTGHTFVGWNTKKDGTGVTYKDASSIKNLTTTHNGVATLYAMWTPTKYKITYNLNGGVNNKSNPSTYTVKSIVSLKAPTKSGYRFAGWYSDSKLTKKVTTIKASTGNKGLYAKWVPNLYTIRFNGNGAAGGSMSDVTKRSYNVSYTLPANKYYRTGHTFVGWNTKKDGTGVTYKDASSIKNLTTTHNGVATLYAMWTPTKYKITYNLNGGVNNKSNPSTYTVKSIVSLKAPTKIGYVFAGWYSDSKLTKKVTTIKANTGNITLYAKWKALSYYANKTNITVSKNDSATVLVTFKKYGTVYWSSSNKDIATGEWGEFNNNTIPLKINAHKAGTTYITLTNSANSEKITIKVVVPNAWDKVQVIIPNTIGEQGNEENRMKILKYSFYDESYSYYKMDIQFQLVEHGNNRTNWGEDFYAYDANGNLLDEMFLYASDLQIGKIYRDYVYIPKDTAKIVFVEYPNTPSIPDEPEEKKWSTSDLNQLKTYLTNFSKEIGYAEEATMKSYATWAISSRVSLLQQAVDYINKAYNYLEKIKELLQNNPTLIVKNGSTALEVINSNLNTLAITKNYVITEENYTKHYTNMMLDIGKVKATISLFDEFYVSQ